VLNASEAKKQEMPTLTQIIWIYSLGYLPLPPSTMIMTSMWALIFQRKLFLLMTHDIDFHTPYHEDDVDPTSRNKGGHPKGSTNAKKRDKAMQVLDAHNWVCNEYAAEQDKNNGTAPAGLRRELVKNAKERFNIEDPKFDVPKQTILIKSRQTDSPYPVLVLLRLYCQWKSHSTP